MKYLKTTFFFFLFLGNISAQWTELPDNMYGDTLQFPFYYGVASGDPTSDGVILWTKVETDITQVNPIPLTYEIATDNAMANVIQTGSVDATILTDWTAKVDVSGLNAASTYYYKFEDDQGNPSQIGRTKTAPSGASSELNFIVASCSSAYSGYFNAYKRIAERDEVDLVIHLGDYIYDFPDPDELVRIPEPFPIDPLYLNEWRDLHRYYLLDPDLRAMRQMHPMAAIWDNHDTDGNDAATTMQAMQAFHEYLPVREQDTDLHLYRTLKYGDLVDIIMMDAQLYRDQDVIAPGEVSCLGTTQYDWLTDEIDNSTAQWRIFGTQKMFGTWNIQDSPINLPIGNDTVVDPGSWDGFELEREMILTHLDDNNIDDNIFISGDLHMALAMDLPIHPFDSTEYDPETGAGSIGVEMMGGSITRGNFDEMGYAPVLQNVLIEISMGLNPHHVYEELVKQGYGKLIIRPDTMFGEFWFSEILEITNEEEMGKKLFCEAGSNHWQDYSIITSTTDVSKNGFALGNPFPNPAKNTVQLSLEMKETEDVSFGIIGLDGKSVGNEEQKNALGNSSTTLELNTSNLAAGIYFISIKGESFYEVRKIVVE
ncbi:MAG: alkaline phosphatase D family protein [Saprospiraceae bacterium]